MVGRSDVNFIGCNVYINLVLLKCLWRQPNIETAQVDRVNEVHEEDEWGGEDESGRRRIMCDNIMCDDNDMAFIYILY